MNNRHERWISEVRLWLFWNLARRSRLMKSGASSWKKPFVQSCSRTFGFFPFFLLLQNVAPVEHFHENIVRTFFVFFPFFPFFSLFSPFFPFFFENNWEQLRTISWEQLRTKTLLFGVKMFSDSLRFYQENSFGKVMIRGIRSRNFVWNFQVIDTGDWLIHLVSYDSRSPEKK